MLGANPARAGEPAAGRRAPQARRLLQRRPPQDLRRHARALRAQRARGSPDRLGGAARPQRARRGRGAARPGARWWRRRPPPPISSPTGASSGKRPVLRDLIRIATEIIGQSYDGPRRCRKGAGRRRAAHLPDLRAADAGDGLSRALHPQGHLRADREALRPKEHVTGLATGFGELDEMTSGFQPSDFIIIAGRPSMGKTAFAHEHRQVRRGGETTSGCSCSASRCPRSSSCSACCAPEAAVDSHKVRTGYLDTRDWTRLTNAAGRLAEAPIFIDDSPALTVLEARAKARRMKAEHGLDMIVIDYLQLMRGRAAAGEPPAGDLARSRARSRRSPRS